MSKIARLVVSVSFASSHKIDEVGVSFSNLICEWFYFENVDVRAEAGAGQTNLVRKRWGWPDAGNLLLQCRHELWHEQQIAIGHRRKRKCRSQFFVLLQDLRQVLVDFLIGSDQRSHGGATPLADTLSQFDMPSQYCPVNLRGIGEKANSGAAFRTAKGVSDFNQK